MVLTQKAVDEMHLEMAKLMREEARERGNDATAAQIEIANMELEDIVKLHKEALKQMGFVPKRLPS